jgi:translation initiation factor 3 subunit D
MCVLAPALQSAAVLATEIKNNANKLFRWTIESLLAGVDLLKLGCVARGSGWRLGYWRD